MESIGWIQRPEMMNLDDALLFFCKSFLTSPISLVASGGQNVEHSIFAFKCSEGSQKSEINRQH